MKTLLRQASAAFAAALVIIAPGAFTNPASAVTKETLVIKNVGTVVKKFSGIPGQFPLTTAVNWTPVGCADGGPGATQCDKVPISVAPPPGLKDGDDWWIEFEVSWDDPDNLNDLDVYLWDNQQIKKASGGTGFTGLDQSASPDNPEKVKLFAPGYDLYNITVLNWAGVNLGYTITATMKQASFDRPFELLAPEYRPPSESPSSGSASPPPPFDYSAVPPESSPFAPAPPAFGEVALTPDDDFSDFAASDFEQQLAAPPLLDINSRIISTRPPKPVPAVVTIFWFGLVPAALLGAGAFLLIRHDRDQLVFV
ncbi:MAG: hypothetical protein ACR2H3_01715 [Acidimicrobiales bacterium]